MTMGNKKLCVCGGDRSFFLQRRMCKATGVARSTNFDVKLTHFMASISTPLFTAPSSTSSTQSLFVAQYKCSIIIMLCVRCCFLCHELDDFRRLQVDRRSGTSFFSSSQELLSLFRQNTLLMLEEHRNFMSFS